MGKKNIYVEILRYTNNPEEIIAMGAKLCYSKADIKELEQGIQTKDQTAFIDKLMDIKHMSPIEHATFTFGIEGVSRSLLAQITRHRIASFSVQSQRYVGLISSDDSETFDYVIPPKIEDLGAEYVQKFENQMLQIQQWYNEWNQFLGAKGEETNEDARFVLPNAAATKILLTMNARELQHFFALRCCTRAQWEIRDLAEQMLNKVKEVAPILFKKAGPGCVSGPCPEGKMSCGKLKEMRIKYQG
jgi:thymidylate synthase (FAD)